MATALGCGGASSAAGARAPGASADARGAKATGTIAHAVDAPGDAEQPAAASPRRVPLVFELRGQECPLPLVHGSVGGVPTWMLIDTGANSHVIAGWLARKAKLATHDVGDQGTDHVGRTISTSRVDKHGMTIDGWGPLREGPTLVAEIPEPVARLGIGAFISPQQLGEGGGAVVLDLAHAEMRREEARTARELVGTRGVELLGGAAAARACEDDDSPIKGLAFVVPASVEGTSVSLLLDTGAHHSDLLAGASVARRFLGRTVANKEQVYAASGRITTRTLRRAKLRVGSYATITDVEVIPGQSDTSCPRDGVLAMDVLRSCVLVLDRTNVYGRCGGG